MASAYEGSSFSIPNLWQTFKTQLSLQAKSTDLYINRIYEANAKTKILTGVLNLPF